MKLILLTAATTALMLGCGDDQNTQGTVDSGVPGVPDATPPPSQAGPYDPIELTKDLPTAGLDGPVHAARDRYGVVHIHATTIGDAAFVQGYVMAHDRLPQLEILRRLSNGTLSELFGALDPGLIKSDMEMRMHRLQPTAQLAYDDLKASTDPVDRDTVIMLDRFAEGVNALIASYQAGTHTFDPVAAAPLSPALAPWTAVDTLMLGRFQSLSSSFSALEDIDATQRYQTALAVFDGAPAPGAPDFDPARDARRGASRDLVRIAPVGQVVALPANVAPAVRTQRAVKGASTSAAALQQRVPEDLLRNASQFLGSRSGFGPHIYRQSGVGSNNWAVAPQHAGGKPLLAGDPHLPLDNPSILYPTHLVVPGRFDIEGVQLPGVPGVLLGHNGKVGWTSTLAFHDVTDVYLETIVPCKNGNGDCVQFNGREVRLQTRTEDIQVGLLGQIMETIQVTYETVPHHGPVIPTFENGRIVPRQGNVALAIRYTGYEVSNELRTFARLWRASSVAEAMAATDFFDFGAVNWIFADVDGHIGLSMSAKIPLRSAASYTWHPVTNPLGAAPLFILSGDGSFEWEGFMDRAAIPQVVDPERGFLGTANSDPVGATFDGILFNDGTIEGRPFYLSGRYLTGLRTDRINRLLQEHIASGTAMTLDDMAAMQYDTQSTVGERMRPHLITALGKIDDANRTQDVTDWMATVDPALLDQIRAANALLSGWTLATPPAVVGTPGQAERDDSTATALFNVWMHFFMLRSLGDEFQAIGKDVHTTSLNETIAPVVALLEQPETLGSGLATATGQPVLCDFMATVDVIESCDLITLMAMQDTLAWLASADGLGTPDTTQWLWGKLRSWTLRPLLPNPELNLPAPDAADPTQSAGYVLAGDNFCLARLNSGYSDLDFGIENLGPAFRFVATPADDGLLRARMSLAGGAIFDRASPHYNDLLEDYHLANQHFDMPFTTAEILAAGQERWFFHTP
jgi:penicillin amidase